MSISADAQALRTHFFNHFRDDIRVVIDNDIPADMAEGETWVRFTVRPAASFHVAGDTEAGSKPSRRSAQVMAKHSKF